MNPIIGYGSSGCVFRPALRIEPGKRRNQSDVSKLMLADEANREYLFMVQAIPHLKHIDNKYFMFNNIELIQPYMLTQKEFKWLEIKMPNAFKNVNIHNISNFMAINMPYCGQPVDDYIYDNGSFKKLHQTHICLQHLLKEAILPMNASHIYHSDIKDSNILIDNTCAHLIDWGHSVLYNPTVSVKMPQKWRNRPLQFNVPFSCILFSDTFYEKYCIYLSSNTKDLASFVKEFVELYVNKGHYDFINNTMYNLFSSDIEEDVQDKHVYVENEITKPFLCDYIVNVLTHYPEPDLKLYLNEVYIHIVDIWGFICTYNGYIELLYNNYANLTNIELKIFKQLKYIYYTYLYLSRNTPYNMDELYEDFNILEKLIAQKI